MTLLPLATTAKEPWGHLATYTRIHQHLQLTANRVLLCTKQFEVAEGNLSQPPHTTPLSIKANRWVTRRQSNYASAHLDLPASHFETPLATKRQKHLVRQFCIYFRTPIIPHMPPMTAKMHPEGRHQSVTHQHTSNYKHEVLFVSIPSKR